MQGLEKKRKGSMTLMEREKKSGDNEKLEKFPTQPMN